MVCYEDFLKNGTENMEEIRKNCLEACKYVKYGLNLNEDFRMAECCIAETTLSSQPQDSSIGKELYKVFIL